MGRDLKCVGKHCSRQLLSVCALHDLKTLIHLVIFIWSTQPFSRNTRTFNSAIRLKWYFKIIFKWILFKCRIENYAWFIFFCNENRKNDESRQKLNTTRNTNVKCRNLNLHIWPYFKRNNHLQFLFLRSCI